MRRLTRWSACLLLAFSVLLILPAAALAAATPAPTLVFPTQQVWPLVIGVFMPLLTYVLNDKAPWISQPVKAIVLLVASAVGTALYTAIDTNVFGLNSPTLQLVLTGIGAALASHHLLWKPSGVSTLLGAYRNYGVHPRTGNVVGTAPPATVPPPPVNPPAA